MRLPVDKFGVRCFDKSVNILTVIANESYNDFAAALQKEIEEETSVRFEGRIKNKREKGKIVPNKQITIENYPELFAIWDKIKNHTKYNGSLLSFRVAGADEDLTRHYADVLATCLIVRYALSFDGLATKEATCASSLQLFRNRGAGFGRYRNWCSPLTLFSEGPVR